MIVSSQYVNTLLGDSPPGTGNNSTLSTKNLTNNLSTEITFNLTDMANNSSISDEDDETEKVKSQIVM